MAAKVTIKSEPLNRFVTTKNGQKQVHYQNAELETKNMRVQLEVEIDSPQQAYAKDGVYDWDVESDVIPGRYGPELARRMTLVQVQRAPAKAA